MKLKSFRVQNFRSVADSGVIRADQITALVGRNESGKSNILLGLTSLNPPGGRKPLSNIKDFPRDRRLEECTDETQVVSTVWELEAKEREELGTLLPGAEAVKEVEVGRYYANECWVDVKVSCPALDAKEVKARMRRLHPQIVVLLESLDEASKAAVNGAWTAFQTATEQTSNSNDCAANITKMAQALRQTLVRAQATLPDAADELIGGIEEKAEDIILFEKNLAEAGDKIVAWLPLFIYIAEFPELHGHQNLTDYFVRKSQRTSTDADRNFEKLAKVAGFDPQQLQHLQQQDDHETRNQLVNRAGAVITGAIRRLWKDRNLKIRFNLDAQHLDTFVSDPNQTYDVEVNLDERSRGFRWFFSFYVSFAADTAGGQAEGAILLLDEPGLYLHATSQGDLLKHLRTDFKNQIIYTTHSPFMVPADAISIVRTVNISQDKGTEVTNDPTGDSRTLFPLQAALGYHLSQTLFIGNMNLVVEGVTDFWILSAVNTHLRAGGKKTYPDDLVITPAGGAPRIPYMVALLTAEHLDVLVLLDDERAGRETKNSLLSSKLIRDTNILLVSEAFPAGSTTEADIEDLIDAAVYEMLVRQCYKAELRGKKLTLNLHIPRIVKRFEDAFKSIGLEFQKTRPARLFMTKLANEADTVLTPDSTSRFEQLFHIVAQRIQRHKEAARSPFQ